MPATQQHCAVTGATGYVGSRICEYFTARGWGVFEFARQPRTNLARGGVHVPFELDSPVDPAVFRDNGVRVLIHCAYDFRPTSWKAIHRVNVEGSTKLLLAAKEGGVDRIVFLSSISAFDGCRSLYGKAKLAVEKVALGLGASVIRPGLVYGSLSSGGMFGSLQRIVAKSHIIPLIGSGRYVQYLVHEDDLCELLLRISDQLVTCPPVPVIVAGARPWSIRDVLQLLSAARQTKTRFVRIPWRMIWLALKIAELCRLPLSFRSDSVISLVRQNPNPDVTLAVKMGCSFREFEDSMADMRVSP